MLQLPTVFYVYLQLVASVSLGKCQRFSTTNLCEHGCYPIGEAHILAIFARISRPHILLFRKTKYFSLGLQMHVTVSFVVLHRTCSLTSLFHMLRYGHCPYFYLCAHFCTVLFRAANVGGVSVINAIMTPSTRGLREALKTEGH